MRTTTIVCLLLSGNVHADIYQCIVDGKKVFQGQPCADAGEKMNLRVLKPSPPTESERERQLIVGKKVAVGMSENALLRSWGKPDRINRSSHGDQWIYERGNYRRQYVYLKNGHVTSWSD